MKRLPLRLMRLSALIPLTLLMLLATGCGLPGTIAGGGRLPQVGPAPTPTPLPPVRFPRDEAPHHDLTEWWYYTGHLHGRDALGQVHTYGFELTFFQTLRGQFPPYYAAHFAVSDITRGQFHFDQRTSFEPASVIPPAGSTAGFNLTLNGWTMQGLNGHDHLVATMADYGIDLNLTALKPPVLHGGNGVITYGQAGFSYYYSRTRIAVVGSLTDHGEPVSVTGQAWMDHQWGNFVSLAGSGWDWYSIQLTDNTEYMLYVIRDARKRPISVLGTFVAADGTATELPPKDIQVRATGTWTSPHTGGVYPSGWQVTIPSRTLSLTLTPALLDQELLTGQSTGVAYWEGAVGVEGQASGHPVSGEGYVELTGYAVAPPGAQTTVAP